MSMKPGVTAQPDASSSRSPRRFGPISWITPSAIATSAARPGVPLPSKTVPPRITTSAIATTSEHDLHLIRRRAGDRPPVDRNHDPGDLRGTVACEEQRRVRDVFGGPVTLQRLREPDHGLH